MCGLAYYWPEDDGRGLLYLPMLIYIGTVILNSSFLALREVVCIKNPKHSSFCSGLYAFPSLMYTTNLRITKFSTFLYKNYFSSSNIRKALGSGCCCYWGVKSLRMSLDSIWHWSLGNSHIPLTFLVISSSSLEVRSMLLRVILAIESLKLRNLSWTS